METFLYISGTVALTVYAQLIMKARSSAHVLIGKAGALDYLYAMYTDVGVLSAFGAAVLASILWALALEKATLSYAYPFMALSFVFVPVIASVALSEPLSGFRIIGLLMIVGGVTISSLG